MLTFRNKICRLRLQKERRQIGQDQPVTRVTQDLTTETIERTEETFGPWYDPSHSPSC